MIRSELNTVLFDLDGTIVEHSHAVLPPLLAEWGYPRLPDEVKSAFGIEIHWFYEHVLAAEEQGWVPELYRQLYARVLHRMGIPDSDGSRVRAIGDFYETHPVPPLFNDVRPVLFQLTAQNWRLGMITQRGRAGVDRFLDEHGLTTLFNVVIAGDDGHGRKPTVHPFQAAFVSPRRCRPIRPSTLATASTTTAKAQPRQV
ncbi:MAG: HAD hydrolase-like protein [Caldilineaceae bacterium]|nr:HAD hydrolase-like protein [Caldilineaceae bacterium]